MNVAIVGTGKIGCDLLVKVKNSEVLKCVSFVGRRESSEGIAFGRQLGVESYTNGISDLEKVRKEYDLIFDCTSSEQSNLVAECAKKNGKKLVNLTPSARGKVCVPILNLDSCLGEQSFRLVSCGGQATTPLIHEVVNASNERVEYVEVISSISAKSAGLATRYNLNEYICNTESAIREITGIENVKVVLNINPAVPEVNMKNSIYFRFAGNPNLEVIKKRVARAEAKMQQMIPGYKLLLSPCLVDGVLMMIVEVTGAGDYLPQYAGNLDIITAISVQIAERIVYEQNSK